MCNDFQACAQFERPGVCKIRQHYLSDKRIQFKVNPGVLANIIYTFADASQPALTVHYNAWLAIWLESRK